MYNKIGGRNNAFKMFSNSNSKIWCCHILVWVKFSVRSSVLLLYSHWGGQGAIVWSRFIEIWENGIQSISYTHFPSFPEAYFDLVIWHPSEKERSELKKNIYTVQLIVFFSAFWPLYITFNSLSLCCPAGLVQSLLCGCVLRECVTECISAA